MQWKHSENAAKMWGKSGKKYGKSQNHNWILSREKPCDRCNHRVFGIPGGNRTHNYALGEHCYIHLTTETYRIVNHRSRYLARPSPATIPLLLIIPRFAANFNHNLSSFSNPSFIDAFAVLCTFLTTSKIKVEYSLLM